MCNKFSLQQPEIDVNFLLLKGNLLFLLVELWLSENWLKLNLILLLDHLKLT